MEIEALPLEELPDGSMRLVPADGLTIGLYHCQGTLHAIEDRCTPRRRPALRGRVGLRRRARSSARGTGRASTCAPARRCRLPAYLPVATYPVSVREDGMIVIDVG